MLAPRRPLQPGQAQRRLLPQPARALHLRPGRARAGAAGGDCRRRPRRLCRAARRPLRALREAQQQARAGVRWQQRNALQQRLLRLRVQGQGQGGAASPRPRREPQGRPGPALQLVQGQQRAVSRVVMGAGRGAGVAPGATRPLCLHCPPRRGPMGRVLRGQLPGHRPQAAVRARVRAGRLRAAPPLALLRPSRRLCRAQAWARLREAARAGPPEILLAWQGLAALRLGRGPPLPQGLLPVRVRPLREGAGAGGGQRPWAWGEAGAGRAGAGGERALGVPSRTREGSGMGQGPEF